MSLGGRRVYPSFLNNLAASREALEDVGVSILLAVSYDCWYCSSFANLLLAYGDSCASGKKRQGSWFRGEKTGAKGSGGATTKHPPPPQQKKM